MIEIYIFFISGSKLTLESLLMVYYFFCQDIPIYLAERIYHDISHTTYVRWYSKFRSCLTNNLHSSGNALDGHIETLQNIDEYEIDESFFGKKRKYNKGAVTKNVWVFGLMERETRNTVFQIVQKRDKNTLTGSIIYSDDWKAYSCLGKDGYVHKVVVHKKEFVSKEGACTNTIEG